MPSCASCKKQLDDCDEEQYAVFTCRNEHVFMLCKSDCRRLFEKRCAKVVDSVLKTQKNLMNDGHTSALRRLPPGEREKFAQVREAEAHGLLVCPEDTKGSVPHCAHVMLLTAGTFKHQPGERHQPTEAPLKPPPPPPIPKLEQELVSDDMLQMLIRDNEDEALPSPVAAAKKSSKKASKKDKAGQRLIFDYNFDANRNFEGADDDEQDGTSVSTTASPADLFGHNQTPWAQSRAPEAKPAATKPTARKGPSQQERNEQIDQLATTLSCSELRAEQLLEDNGWDLLRAADAALGSAGASVTKPWGGNRQQPAAQTDRTSAQKQPRQRQESLSQSQTEPSQTESTPRDVQQPQPKAEMPSMPSQPPPPRLPKNWKPVWCDGHQCYYFWHTMTNQVTWDKPELDEEEAKQEQKVTQVSDITGIDSIESRALLKETGWDVENAVRTCSQREEIRKAEEAARRRAEKERVEREAELELEMDEAEEEEIRRVEAEQEENYQRALARQVEREPKPKREPMPPHPEQEHYVCKRHWKPKDDVEGCIRIFHGERVKSMWTEGANGWAYVVFLDDPTQEGYVPQDILQVPQRPAQEREKGETLTVLEAFEAPAEVSGYLSAAPGELVSVMYPVSGECVWAYCENESTLECGWMPECVLSSCAAAT
mmetsp:Transcript_34725/g.63093  ORF Transcript_34725/g.63093 Transcript_34725/m.63093 type:complete len:656 (-) Transcript_34725:82-2049(-)|eukprot:CAMPEP_0197660928 /NCGR_PEP_ID=MMETSP1338-20131121/51146_1 /TAXON_ID=43686 ORGANISM="Pelagodinium beii, Strain RCC1491" /NCGR_SAMPLE_ID=MMETSP1338 /ASSEMBLY_ACC=CAM_ASM_000754 /LENGTH=655 /DNA_ID=CAMNT_0043238385 /DNA_START=64 /DNA_END=2031 /DNA_ORIENTATION=-